MAGTRINSRSRLKRDATIGGTCSFLGFHGLDGTNMSEYQFIDFVAIDSPVSDQDLEYMTRQSTRAEITKWRFTNEYHFGDFHGNVTEMLRRGYDMHLHFADFGIRKIMIRLPLGLPYGKSVFARYAVLDFLTWEKDKRGKGGVLTIEPEADAGTFDYLEDVESYLDRLVPLREMLIRGDLRPLFLAWLVCSYDEDAIVPPIPAGLDQLTDPLQALAEFYEIPDKLIATAAADDLPTPSLVDTNKLVTQWIAKQKKADLQDIVTEFMSDDPSGVRSRIIAGITHAQDVPPWPTVDTSLTLGELRTRAGLS